MHKLALRCSTVGAGKSPRRASFFDDPRLYQIVALSFLTALGVMQFGLDLPWWHVGAVMVGAQVTQYIGDRCVGRPYDPRSPLISALSLTLLLRTGSVGLSLLAAILAIGSKYIVRRGDKHIFNPANLGLVVVAVLFDGAWISPGQWGAAPLLAIGLIGLGGIVTGKARRWDISAAFLIVYATALLIRALWLGDPLTIPWHQLQNGALLIFAFFMISDPKTTPNHRSGRLLYAAIVALTGFVIQFAFYESAGIILALIITAPLVSLIDVCFHGPAYQWPGHRCVQPPTAIGESHVSSKIPAQ